MKRILILCAALALPAAVGVSNLNEAEDLGTPLAAVGTQDTSVVVRRVYEGPSPDFWGTCPSPDGRYVTQTDWDTGDLAVLDLLTGQKRRVTGKGDDGWAHSYAYSEAACFSPDGQRIAYVWYTEPGTYELRVINVDGTGSHLVARAGFKPTDPPPSYIDDFEWYPGLHGWSPDGMHILATLYRGREEGEVTLLSVEDGSKEVLYVSGGIEFAALSPDGRQLAFAEEEDVFVKSVSGGHPEIVASGPATDLLLGWSEDGSVLYFSDRDLTEAVWRAPIRDGRLAGDAELVATDLWGMKPMGVSGGSLFYGIQTQAPRLHVVPLDLTRNRLLGLPMPVEPMMRQSSFPSWSPDGQNLLYWVGTEEEARLILRSTTSDEVRDVTPESLNVRQTSIRWSEDGHRVLIRAREHGSEKRAFFAYTLATGETEEVFSSDGPSGGGSGWEEFSRDWRTVYLAVRELPEDPTTVFRRDLSTGDEQVLFSSPNRSTVGPTISRMNPSQDNRSLAYWEIAEENMGSTLNVISREGEPRTLLTVSKAEGFDYLDYPVCQAGRYPLWTSDGRHLLTILQDSIPTGEPFPPSPCKLYKVPVEGGDPVFVGAIPQHFRMWALSPDDSRLAIETGEFRGEIWIMQGLDRR